MTPARIGRVAVGCLFISIGFGLTLRAHLGLGPWHVLQQGLSHHLGVSVGTAGMVTASVLFVVALLLRERPGLGTAASIVLLNVFIDLVLPLVPTPHGMPARLGVLGAGLVVMSFGAALYLSADLGASPLDAVMTGIYRRVPWSLYTVRIGLELVGFVLGWAAGGEIGLGCVVVGLGIGPGIELWLRLLGAMPLKTTAHTPEMTGEAVLPGR